MEGLPIEVLTEIFSHFDDESMWNAMKVCKIWTEVFTTSTKLNERFQLQITKEFIETQDLSNLPNIPIKNISIIDVNIEEASNFKKLSELINTYKHSIKNFSMTDVHFTSIENLKEILKDQSSLKNLKISNLNFFKSKPIQRIFLPQLQSLSIKITNNYVNSMKNIFDLFTSNESIEKIELTAQACNSNCFDHESFNNFVKTLPKFKHLIMNGHGILSYLNHKEFPSKLEKFEVFALGFHWRASVPRLDFLKSQTGSLRELKLHRLPFDTDGGEVLKFIIEEMNLENFYYDEIPLILNEQKQEIEEIWVSEASVNALMEILRQFPMIKILRLTLIGCSIGALHLTEILSLPTNLFNQLQELIIIDNSRHEFQNFVNLYKNCKNIKRLTIETKESKLSELLKEFLPIMTQLEEFKLVCDDFDINKRLEVISENCLSLKVLKIKKEHLENARRIFNDFNDLIFEII
ncbi:hypothetical protein PVAND_016916 [Polypedilum vanderplanki]|uniref:F-box domain-containing protein n=1 Tax=Polypedilum vanderplanki TaxID=319348 RepID=A0A9J6BGT1_POLVA|nr:hypothetical protein PVAND_016916 [Polypedilum vanderplanki]